jgi:hypothetical protein
LLNRTCVSLYVPYVVYVSLCLLRFMHKNHVYVFIRHNNYHVYCRRCCRPLEASGIFSPIFMAFIRYFAVIYTFLYFVFIICFINVVFVYPPSKESRVLKYQLLLYTVGTTSPDFTGRIKITTNGEC